MFDEETPKKHRHKRGYTVLIVSADSDGSTGTLRVGHIGAQILAFTLFFAAVALICYIVYSIMTIDGLQKVNVIQSERIAAAADEKSALEAENSELSARVDQLSKSLSQKVVKETNAEREEAEKYIPTGFPLTGAATMTNTRDPEEADTIEEALALLREREENGETADSVPGDEILYFTDAAEGSSVIATGGGTVSLVGEDKKYGNRVEIDHGNGYMTIYRNAGDAMVREGDEVIRGSILFVIGDNKTVGYQITLDGEYIDPETMAEIDG